MLWDMYVASQGAYKDIKKYADSIEPVKELGAEDLLKMKGIR